MKWHFSELQKYKAEAFPFEETLDLKPELTTLFKERILDVTPVEVKGFAQAVDGDILVHAQVKTTIVTPSTRSLEPVTLPLDFAVDEVYVQEASHANRYDEEDSVMLVEEFINFKEALIEFIGLAVPLQVLTDEEAADDTMPSGQDWVVMSETDYAALQQEEASDNNTPFANLADLFNEDK